ncbi:MAG: HAD-IIIA family hydrolase [Planctomycetota bacterium]
MASAAITGQATWGEPPAQHAGFTAMILAGGLGTRLLPAVADRPKPLALVAGEPFLARMLDQLAAAGCVRAILCTGHKGDQYEREFGPEHAGIELVYSRETTALGTGGALRHALPLLGDAHALVLNGDSYTDIALRSFVASARAASGRGALVAVEVADCSRYGRIVVDPSGHVRAFTEKGHTGAGLVNAGIYWLPRTLLEDVPPGACSLERELLPLLVGGSLTAFCTAAAFLDIGTPESYAAAETFFAACARRRVLPRHGLLVVDRDGTLIEERHYLANPDRVELLPGVVQGLLAFAALGYELAIVTNQSGIGRGYFDERTLDAVHRELRRQLEAAGIVIHGIWHCPHHPDAQCACRKPQPELLQRAMHDLGYAKDQCLVVGDKACDIELGARFGVRTALVRTGYGRGTERDGLCAPDVVVDDLAQLAERERQRRKRAPQEATS